MDNNKDFSPEASIRLINEMIMQAKQDYQRQSFFFLLWGWLLALTGIGHFLLAASSPRFADLLWPLQGIVGGLIVFIYLRRQEKTGKTISSHLNPLLGNIWLAFAFTLFLLISVAVNAGKDPIPFILILTALPTFLTGKAIRFSPLVWGGVSFWLFGIVSCFTPQEYNSLVFSAAIAAGYLLPGYLLKKSENITDRV